MTQLDEITLIELEVDMVHKYSPTFLSIDVVNGELKIVVCSDVFNNVSVLDRTKDMFTFLKEDYRSLTEKLPIIVNCYSIHETNAILDGL